MANYEVVLKVKVLNVDDDSYFHEDTMDFLIETGIIDDATIEAVNRVE